MTIHQEFFANQFCFTIIILVTPDYKSGVIEGSDLQSETVVMMRIANPHMGYAGLQIQRDRAPHLVGKELFIINYSLLIVNLFVFFQQPVCYFISQIFRFLQIGYAFFFFLVLDLAIA